MVALQAPAAYNPVDRFSLTPEGHKMLELLENPTPLPKFSLDALWEEREAIDEELKELRNRKTQLEAELHQRFMAAHPNFTADGSSGSIDLAGKDMTLRMTYTRDYEYDDHMITELAGLSMDRPDLITVGEFADMVSYKPVVNAMKWNSLLRRGGELADLLKPIRTLKSFRPQFERKERRS